MIRLWWQKKEPSSWSTRHDDRTGNDLLSQRIVIVDTIILFEVVYQHWTSLVHLALLSLLHDSHHHHVY